MNAELAATGGVGNGIDAIKTLMAGATTVQVVAEVLRKGPSAIGRIREQANNWMDEHEYASLTELRGSMSWQRASNPDELERANYMQVLRSWKPS